MFTCFSSVWTWECEHVLFLEHLHMGKGSNRLINRLLRFCSLWSLSACGHVCVMKDVTKAHDRHIRVPITHRAVHTHLNLFPPQHTHIQTRLTQNRIPAAPCCWGGPFHFRKIPHSQVHCSLSVKKKKSLASSLSYTLRLSVFSWLSVCACLRICLGQFVFSWPLDFWKFTFSEDT